MDQDDTAFMLGRPEAAGQRLQRRCFVASSFRNRDVVASVVGQLRAEGWFVYNFTVTKFSVSEQDWGGMSHEQAKAHPEIAPAARSDVAMLRCLGAADVMLVVLPAGFSAGWEAGFATARGAKVVVCGEELQSDVPLLHADAVFPTVDEAVVFVKQFGQPSGEG